MDNQNVFLTDDIVRADYDSEAVDRYEFTENLDEFLQFVSDYSDKATPAQKKEAERLYNTFPASLDEVREWIADEGEAVYDEWCNGCSYDERYAVPIMTCLRYYPDFVQFNEVERYKVSGSTCLLYDTEREAWAVGMTGGGMDLSPHLLATFIELGKGVPRELAGDIRPDYAAYVKREHASNCAMLADAYIDEAHKDARKAAMLRGKAWSHEDALTLKELTESDNETIRRNAISIKKTIEKGQE